MDKRSISDLSRAVSEGRDEIRQGLLGTLPERGRIDRERMRWIAKADRAELWRGEGARNTAEWLSALFHISNWKARRWVGAAHALEELPLVAAALESGSLSLDKVGELTRFATPEDEKKLVRWARRVTVATIRTRADEHHKRTALEAEEAQRVRYLRTQRWDEHMEIGTLLTLAEGDAVMAAVDQLADELPRHPDEDGNIPGSREISLEQRRADALVLLVTRTGRDDEARPTVIVHAPIDSLAHDTGGATAPGGVLHPETARRLACDSALQVVIEGKDATPIGIGRKSQSVPRWLRRQVLRRDGHTCTFPGCEMKRFLHPHHIRHWARGGPTDLDNLITVCTFHHKMLHEGRWSVTLGPGARPVWFRPGGRVYEPGPAPPEEPPARLQRAATFAEAAGYSRLFDLIRPHEVTRRRKRRRRDEIPDWGRIELGLKGS